MNTKFNKELTLNKPCDEEIWFYKATGEDLETVGEFERENEDAYDNAFTKLVIEQFTHLKNSNTLNIGSGNFDYVSDIWNREMYENAWQAISLTNMWDFVKQDIDSFMFSLDTRLDTISEKMEEIGYNVHSSASFGRTMRQMQFLAKFGEDKFKECFNVDGQINDHDFNTIRIKNEDKLLDYMGGY